jgi:hypothetical protein
MRYLIMTMALLAATGVPATAQTGSAGSSATTTSQQSREAPVGHRQPRAGDRPSERNPTDPNDPLSKENAALDKKIKNICRGC